jgi:hypothetical protein
MADGLPPFWKQTFDNAIEAALLLKANKKAISQLEKEYIQNRKNKKQMENNSTKQMTLGEERCHINFNPSSDDKIGTFKRMIADAIDYCNAELQNTEDGEAKRCFSIAMTELETAQMYGVKGIAKGLK